MSSSSPYTIISPVAITDGESLNIGGSVTSTRFDSGGTAGWYNLGTLTASLQGSRAAFRIIGNAGYNTVTGSTGGESIVHISVNNNSSTSVTNATGTFYSIGANGESPLLTNIKLVQNGANRMSYSIYANMNAYSAHTVHLNATAGVQFTQQLSAIADPGANSATVQALTEGLQLHSQLYIRATADTVSTAGGALRVAGSVGIAGNMVLDSGKTLLYAGTSSGGPGFVTRSLGSRVVLFPLTGATTTDYAIGMETGHMWFASEATASTTTGFKWYGGTSQIARLDGAGQMYVGTQLNIGSTTQLTSGGKLTLNGPAISNAGPHIHVYTTADAANPIFQQLNHNSDGIYMGFGVWYNGSNWISTSAGANFTLIKTNTAFQVQCNSGIAVSSVVSSFKIPLSIAAATGDITIASNQIFSASMGGNAPTFTTRSTGTRIVLYPTLSATAVDWAFGIGASTLWYSMGQALSSNSFRWYGGTTQLMSLDGTGILTTNSSGGIVARFYNSSATTQTSIVLTNSANTKDGYVGLDGPGFRNYVQDALTLLSPSAKPLQLESDTSINAYTPYMLFPDQTRFGAPTFTTRSIGTKLVIYPNIASTAVDYALGIDGGTMWLSVPNSTSNFRFYGGVTQMAQITGNGITLSPAGITSASAYLFGTSGSGLCYAVNATEYASNSSAGDIVLRSLSNNVRICGGGSAASAMDILSTGTISLNTPVNGQTISNLNNTLLAFEDQSRTTTNSGVLSGNSLYSQNDSIRLTSAAAVLNGWVSWRTNPGFDWTAECDINYGGGNGADGISFAVYQPGLGDYRTNSGGYVVAFSEYQNAIYVINPTLTTFGAASITNYTTLVPSGTWVRVIITFRFGVLRVYVGGVLRITYTATAADVAATNNAQGTYMYYTALSGGSTNNHYVRNIKIYRGSGTWSLSGSSTTLEYNLGNINVGSSTDATQSSGALVVTGGASIGKTLFVGSGVIAPNIGSLRNRIINGDMRVDQRYSGANVPITASNMYFADRWRIDMSAVPSGASAQAILGAINNLTGFPNALRIANSATPSANNISFLLYQIIEGYNIADLQWGTAYSQPVTVSFYVYTSIAGLYSCNLVNGGANYSYAATYTVATANTWQYVTLTIPGCTSGTWSSTNGMGVYVEFPLNGTGLGAYTPNTWANANYFYPPPGAVNWLGTASSVFYLTGVQFEKGTIASPFEQLPYDFALRQCQRYYEIYSQLSSVLTYLAPNSASYGHACFYKAPKRISPTVTATVQYLYNSSGTAISSPLNCAVNIDCFRFYFNTQCIYTDLTNIIISCEF